MLYSDVIIVNNIALHTQNLLKGWIVLSPQKMVTT